MSPHYVQAAERGLEEAKQEVELLKSSNDAAQQALKDQVLVVFPSGSALCHTSRHLSWACSTHAARKVCLDI
eukprot:scaffold209353_cov18-Tisochrysis_lutea.AAC.2